MRGESARVAARVRHLLGEADSAPADHDRAPVERVDARSGGGRWAAWRARLAGSWRLDPGRRGALAVGGAVLVAAVVTGAWVVLDRPQPVAVAQSPANDLPPASSGISGSSGIGAPTSAPTGAATSAAAPVTASSTAGVVVDVAGKVRRPGLYHLPAGARVDDAVRAAGGPLRGVSLTSLNLAAKVADGQQITVGVAGAAPVAGGAPGTDAGSGGASSSASGGIVDLNTATSEQLQTLPGVGPVLAQHILDWRAEHGRFDSVARLNDVPGIGDVKFAALRSRVSV